MKIWPIIKIMYKEGQNVGFWVLLIFGIFSWLSSVLSIQYIIILVLILLLPLAYAIKSAYQQLYTSHIKAQVETKLFTNKRVENQNSKTMRLNIPTEYDIKQINSYLENFASQWASDAIILDSNYYIDITLFAITKSVQSFIYSSNRAERLTKYLPNNAETVEDSPENGYTRKQLPTIYSFPKWRENIILAIEKNASDIDISDRARIQISPGEDSLGINFYFYLKNKEWHKGFVSKDGKLEKLF